MREAFFPLAPASRCFVVSGLVAAFAALAHLLLALAAAHSVGAGAALNAFFVLHHFSVLHFAVAVAR